MSAEQDLCFGPFIPQDFTWCPGDKRPDAWVVAMVDRTKTPEHVAAVARVLQDKLGLSAEDSAQCVFRGTNNHGYRPGYFSTDEKLKLSLHNLTPAERATIRATPGPVPTAHELLDQTLRREQMKYDNLKAFVVINLRRMHKNCTCKITQNRQEKLAQVILDDQIEELDNPFDYVNEKYY